SIAFTVFVYAQHRPLHSFPTRRSSDLHRQEARLGAVGGVGLITRLGQRALALGAVGDVAADALHLRRRAGIVAHEALAPGDPARSEEHTSELQSRFDVVCRRLLAKTKA